MQGTWVWSLVQEDSTWCRVIKPGSHNYFAHMPTDLALQQEKSCQWEAHALHPESLCKCTPTSSFFNPLSCLSFFLHVKVLVTQLYLTLQLRRLQPTWLLSPWMSPDKNTGLGSHFLFQGIFPTQGLNPHLLIRQADFFYRLTYQGSPNTINNFV